MTRLRGRLAAWWRDRRRWTGDPAKGHEATQEIRARNLEAEANRQRQFPGGM